jgi:hypothetical protein
MDYTAKTRIIRDLQGDLLDSNHATRRFFRCWLDGSYLGEEHYRDNVAYLRQSLSRYGVGMKLEAKIRGWVIGQFVRYTAHDAQCSHGYAQRVIVDTVDGETLSELTHHLITDALDLIEDDIREHLKETANV